MPCLKLIIPDLTEHADEARLQQAFLAEPGVFSVVASHRSRCIEIDFEDDEVSIDRLLQIARQVGFEAKPAS